MNCSKHNVKLICPVCEGEKHGAKGGKKAAKSMSLRARRERARKAAMSRWGTKD